MSRPVDGGGGGIRTHETLSRLPVFKTGAFNHSATPPGAAQRGRDALALIGRSLNPLGINVSLTILPDCRSR